MQCAIYEYYVCVYTHCEQYRSVFKYHRTTSSQVVLYTLAVINATHVLVGTIMRVCAINASTVDAASSSFSFSPSFSFVSRSSLCSAHLKS